MSIIPEGPMPNEIADALRKRLEEGINEPRLTCIITINNNGELQIFSTWDNKSEFGAGMDTAVASAMLRRASDNYEKVS